MGAGGWDGVVDDPGGSSRGNAVPFFFRREFWGAVGWMFRAWLCTYIVLIEIIC